MRRIAKFRKQRICALTAAIVASAWMPTAMAGEYDLPERDSSKAMTGVEEIESANGKMKIVLNDKRAAVDWSSFDIGPKAEVNFKGEKGWAVLNRVSDGGKASEIYGNLKGEGISVFLINPSGITFGEDAHVDVGSLVASTLDITGKDFDERYNNFKNGNFTFDSGDRKGIIKNLGEINANDGVVVLLAHQVFNGKDVSIEDMSKEIPVEDTYNAKNVGGKITAGQVAMVAGKNVTLEKLDKKVKNTTAEGIVVKYADKIGVKLNNEVNELDMVINGGNINAQQGYVLMKAKEAQNVTGYVICNTGTVKANHMSFDKDGNVILDAEGKNIDGEGGKIDLKGGNVNAGGKLDASGTNGGNVNIIGNPMVTADISANGTNGKGGEVSIKGDQVSVLDSKYIPDGIGIPKTGSGSISAKGIDGEGGKITIKGKNLINIIGGKMSADGNVGGNVELEGSQLDVRSEIAAKGSNGVGGKITVKGSTSINGSLSVDSTSSTGGTINLTGKNLEIAGTLSADGKNGGTINTIASDNLQVFDAFHSYDTKEINGKSVKVPDTDVFGKADIHAKATDSNGEAGTWNISAAQAVIENVTYDKDNEANSTTKSDLTYYISNNVISKALNGANVNVTVTSNANHPEYYSDIRVNEAITKSDAKDTNLTMTAGRNIVVDGNITSSAGKLNVILNSNKQVEKNDSEGKSIREDGANIIRADIKTNGGNFTTTGTNGIYFGVKDKTDIGKNRYVYTNGGDITLGGNEVLLATGGEVVFDTTSEDIPNGKVTIEGTVNSAHYYCGEDNGSNISWDTANNAANEFDKDANNKPTGKSHLAVITSALEDAVVSSALKNKEAYVGGHVVAVETNTDG